MKMVATTTVIRGNGGCEAYMNGVVRKEILKMSERYKKEMARKDAELSAVKRHRDLLLGDKLKSVEYAVEKKNTVFSKIREWIVKDWCMFWALCSVLGLWEYVGDEENA